MTDVDSHMIDRLDLFNARDMTASQVADNFVQPEAYERIAVPSNTLLMGPRGSGKTTLLKMLTPEGTESRPSDSSPDPLFSGLYVPIDIQLADQLDSLATAGLEPALTEAGITSLFAFHVFRSVAKSFSWHCPSATRHSSSAVLTTRQEADAVVALAALWQTDVAVPTIGALQQSLRVRQIRAIESWNRQVLRHRSGRNVQDDLVHMLDLDVGLKGAVEVIAGACTWNGGSRWAVLFDEVEVAPETLQRHLLSYLRHSDTEVLFKVAIAPYMQAYRGLPDRARASALNDYVVVDLQAASEQETEDFSAAFFAKSVKTKLNEELDIYSALGPSTLAGSSSRDADESYGPRSLQARSMRSLARKDPTFVAYLEKNGMTAEDLLGVPTSDRRAPLRKVRQVALVRDAYLKSPLDGGRRVKSRVSTGRLYVGAAGVMRMCEGNPRRLAFITPMLLASLRQDMTVPFAAQSDAVYRTEAAFRSFLRGLPVSEDVGGKLPRGLLSFIDLIGRNFHLELIAKEFPEDPVASFIVDSNSDEAIEELIARGVNSGALVQLSDSDSRGSLKTRSAGDPIITSRGKRFRLSYLLSPGYGLTQRVGRAISLSTVIRRSVEHGQGTERRIGAALLDGQRGLW